MILRVSNRSRPVNVRRQDPTDNKRGDSKSNINHQIASLLPTRLLTAQFFRFCALPATLFGSPLLGQPTLFGTLFIFLVSRFSHIVQCGLQIGSCQGWLFIYGNKRK